MAETIEGVAISDAMGRACAVLVEQREYFTELDQAVGDGDMGITLAKIGRALQDYIAETTIDDVGQWIARAGMAANKAGPSTMGTLLATALMRAGKEVMGQSHLSGQDIAAMFLAANQGMQDRGKANLGDKTIIDAIDPASKAFADAIHAGATVQQAGAKALVAAREGRDRVTAQRSKIGRASWVGERTEGKVDPGCEMFVQVLEAVSQ